jgi:transposase
VAQAREGGPGGPTARKYPEEFRQRAAQLVLDGRRSVRDVAGELGVDHETLRNWVAAELRQQADGPAALSADERFELAGLRRKVAELELERESDRGVLCEFIAAEKTGYGVRRLCRLFGISRTSFYSWATRAGGPTAAEVEDVYAIESATRAWADHRRSTGPPADR